MVSDTKHLLGETIMQYCRKFRYTLMFLHVGQIRQSDEIGVKENEGGIYNYSGFSILV